LAQSKINQEDVRLQLPDDLRNTGRVGRLTDDLHVVPALQHLPQLAANAQLIIGNQNSCH
jgi:hypothetical protein